MIDQPLYFVAGLPRSGTTLLMNLLGQNPAHHVSPTSGLIHLLRQTLRTWRQQKEFRSQGLETAKPFVLGALRGLLYGFYEQPLAEGRAVFDKSRGWLHYVEPLEAILGRRVQMIAAVRDVREMVASFEKLYRRRGIEFHYPEGDDAPATLTTLGRGRYALREDRVTGRSIARLRDALARCPDRLLILPYAQLAGAPQEALAAVHDFLGLPPFAYDPEHVVQLTHEDDCVNGMDLHRIRQRVTPAEPAAWQGVLPDELAADIAARYADINQLAAGPIARGDTLQR